VAHIIQLKTFSDARGNLTVMEKEIPFQVRRIYYIYGVDQKSVRAGHRHKKNIQALVCLSGSCEIYVNNGQNKETFRLDSPDKFLLMEPQDWHTMYHFTPDAVLLVLASEPYDLDDYIDEEYP